jgi:HEAT repeat protein
VRALTVDEVRELIAWDTLGWEFQVIPVGEAAFPGLAAIIADPKSDPMLVGGCLVVLTQMEGPRGRFVDLAVAKLSDHGLRRTALVLLAQIGSSRDAPPIAVLLSDPDRAVVREAAAALAAIGDRRALVALDIWLMDGNHRDDGELLVIVGNHRDALQKRLDEADKKREAAPPPRPVPDGKK